MIVASCANCGKQEVVIKEQLEELDALRLALKQKEETVEAQAKAAHGIELGLERENNGLRESQSSSNLALSEAHSRIAALEAALEASEARAHDLEHGLEEANDQLVEAKTKLKLNQAAWDGAGEEKDARIRDLEASLEAPRHMFSSMFDI